jgi:hypothetical protein
MLRHHRIKIATLAAITILLPVVARAAYTIHRDRPTPGLQVPYDAIALDEQFNWV